MNAFECIDECRSHHLIFQRVYYVSFRAEIRSQTSILFYLFILLQAYQQMQQLIVAERSDTFKAVKKTFR